jgi:tetratricopeptide (TPR) repeat protein
LAQNAGGEPLKSPRADLAESYNNRANARYVKGDYDAAIADYNLALALNPRCAEVYANRRMLHLRSSRRAEADADFARCVALKPDMKSSLEQRVNQLQAQFQIQIRIPGH